MSAQKLLEFGMSIQQVTLLYVTFNLIFTAGVVFVVFSFIENRLNQFGTGKNIYSYS